jgi:hypothetical protein
MYFWNINKLKQQLIETGLTEQQLFYYILIVLAAEVICNELITYLPYTEPNSWSCIESALNILIPILGTIAAFRANGGDSGIKFVERYFSIGFVVSIRFLVLLIPLMALLIGSSGVIYGFKDNLPDLPNSIEVIISSSWYAAVYMRIVKHIGDVAKAQHDNNEKNR